MTVIVGGHSENFDKASQGLLDLLTDLAEDLAERGQDHSKVESACKQTVVCKESVRAQSAFLHEQLHKDDLDREALKIQLASLKEATARCMDFSKRPEFVAFQERIWHVQHPDLDFPGLSKDGAVRQSEAKDQEFSVTAHKDAMVCPITRKPFVDPHRSPCGHVFERTAIEQMLQGNRNIPCPVAGCRAHIARKDLQPDASVRRRVEQAGRRRL